MNQRLGRYQRKKVAVSTTRQDAFLPALPTELLSHTSESMTPFIFDLQSNALCVVAVGATENGGGGRTRTCDLLFFRQMHVKIAERVRDRTPHILYR